MSTISAVSATVGYHPAQSTAGARGAQAPAQQAPQATDADRDGDVDTPGRVDVKG